MATEQPLPLDVADERIGELMGSDRVLGRRRDVATRDWPTDTRGATGTDRSTPVGLLPQRGPVVYLEQVSIQLLREGKG